MSKAYCDKLQPKPTLIQIHTYKVNGANGNSLGPLEQPHVPLNSPKIPTKFNCKHLLQPIILGLDFSHNYLIGIDWFFTNQLHLL